VIGSVARRTDTSESDIRLMVTFVRQVTLSAQLRLAERLHQMSGRRVALMNEAASGLRVRHRPGAGAVGTVKT